ncbi:MAG: hypothetical protein WA432_00830 [Candidatus Babeliaceae bacterium]
MKKLLTLVALLAMTSTVFGIGRRGCGTCKTEPSCHQAICPPNTNTCDPEPCCTRMVEVKEKPCKYTQSHTSWMCPETCETSYRKTE